MGVSPAAGRCPHYFVARLELRVSRRPRKRDHVADVGHAGDKLHGPLQAQPETRVWHAAETTQVEIPPVGGRVESLFAHAGFELRTARIWWTGHVLDPNLKYGLQLALGPNDFEPGNASPIFDLYVESLHLRESNGILPPRFTVEKVIVQMKGFIAKAPRESPLYVTLSLGPMFLLWLPSTVTV